MPAVDDTLYEPEYIDWDPFWWMEAEKERMDYEKERFYGEIWTNRYLFKKSDTPTGKLRENFHRKNISQSMVHRQLLKQKVLGGSTQKVPTNTTTGNTTASRPGKVQYAMNCELELAGHSVSFLSNPD